ncbi:uncharacterized protein LOC110981386 isoform X2 [Acanthaster planci]|uniref:Uncharacterized protein LOC110981386 isoform X2 n=1 Tax=Acanthaster planci TaxID=133434 RepID=A0A8B7YMX3_ACAPL|nr:uncharacterized protein LOC110981386 isoform X2 [Acanthaster planci]
MATTLQMLMLVTAMVTLSHQQEKTQVMPKIAYENCGPPFNLTIFPNPPKVRQVLNITVEIVAAHDMVAGVLEAYMNYWPYHYKDVYCADGKTIDPKGCYVTKGEKRVISDIIWIDDNFKEMDYKGNATIRNERDELMICIRAWME